MSCLQAACAREAASPQAILGAIRKPTAPAEETRRCCFGKPEHRSAISKADLARAEGVSLNIICVAITRGLEGMEKYLKKSF